MSVEYMQRCLYVFAQVGCSLSFKGRDSFGASSCRKRSFGRDLRYFAHAHIHDNWNSKFRMSISNTPHDRIGARNMILQIKQQLAPVTSQGSKLSESNLRTSLPRNQTCSEESASIK